MLNKDLEEIMTRQSAVSYTITEIKNALKGTKKITKIEEQISELEDRMVAITQVKQNKEKRNEDSLINLWDNINNTNI